MKKSLLILTFSISVFSFSQNEFLDFVINKKNDTIYGTIRNVFSKKGVLYEKVLNSEKSKLKFRSHKLRKQKMIRLNDDIYIYVKPPSEDGIYVEERKIIPEDSVAKIVGDFYNLKKRLPDYIITNENDTIHGKIKRSFLGDLYFLNSSNEKIKIETNNIKGYRFDNEIFDLKKHLKVSLLDYEDCYLKLLLDGNVKLYEYNYYYTNQINSKQKSSERKIYLEKDNTLKNIDELFYKKQLTELFSDNQPLVSKILNEEYVFENIYLIVKYYNKSN